MEQNWSRPWNPADPIELLFDNLEECCVLSVSARPAYTAEQMIEKAITSIQRTGLYSMVIMEWKAFTNEDKTWPEFKAHFSEDYETRLQSGTTVGNPYHGAAKAFAGGDEDSNETITQRMANMHHASNINAQKMSDNMLAMTTRLESMNSIIQAQQQQVSNMAHAPAMESAAWTDPAAASDPPTNI